MKRIIHSLCLILFSFFCFWQVFGGASVMGGESGAPPLSVKASIDREYGYYIGDLVTASYIIDLPPHHTLNPASLPKEHSSLDSQIDIKNIIIKKTGSGGYPSYRTSLIYQVFVSTERADFFDIPEIHFSYGPDENPSLRTAVLPPLRIVISPLAPEGASYKPAIPWMRKSFFSGILWWVGIALLLTNSLFLFFLIRKSLSTRSPFTLALRKMPGKTDALTALVVFRSALNEAAGKAIFASNLDDFIQAIPRGAAYRDELRELILLSDEMSFNPEYHPEPDGSVKRIRWLMKKLRRGQRWA